MNREIEHGDGTQAVPTWKDLAVHMGDHCHAGVVVFRTEEGYTSVDVTHGHVGRHERLLLIKEKKGEQVFLPYGGYVSKDLDHPEVIWLVSRFADGAPNLPEGTVLLWDSKDEID